MNLSIKNYLNYFFYKNDFKLDLTNKNDIYLVIEQEKIGKIEKTMIERYLSDICQLIQIKHLCVEQIANKVYPQLKSFNSSEEVDEQIIRCVCDMTCYHYDYPKIAIWILINELHRTTEDDYFKLVNQMYYNYSGDNRHVPIISKSFLNFVRKYQKEINQKINYHRDHQISIFGYRTLTKSYLKKDLNDKIIERPQHMYMRVAISIHYRNDDLDKIFETYELLSQGYFIHATPTLFNAGTNREQLSSCFILGIEDDMGEIGECWKNCALISKNSGGIGVHVSNLRVNGAIINTTQGKSSGLRVLRVFNEIGQYANQGGKRSGNMVIYIEPWHADIMFFLNLKKNTGAETERTRDLYLGLMINDLFMKRVENDEIWSLMCPHQCPDITNKYGHQFEEIYHKYESAGQYVKQMSARELWFEIMNSQIETGIPYILYKDHVNYKSNQMNIGVINGSNLCAEIVEVSTSKEYAVCFTKDTLIVTNYGMRKIIDCDQKMIFSYFNNDSDLAILEHFEKARLICNNMKPVYEIKLQGTRPIKATEDHPFLVLNQDPNTTITPYNIHIWKTLKELQCGDLIVSPEINPLPKFEIDRKSFDNDLLVLSQTDSEENIINYVENIKQLTPIKQASFLSGLFSKSGTVKSVDNHLVIELISFNLNLLYDIQSLLIPFGIRSDIRSENCIRILTISSQCSLLNFQSYINFENAFIIKNIFEIEMSNSLTTFRKTQTYRYVEQIEYVGIEMVYDLALPNSHNFLVNGQVAHNCNLVSICLPKYVISKDNKLEFDYQKLYQVSRIAARNLNNIIDINYYPVIHAEKSNEKHRPIGIGVQGLADVFALFKTPFDSDLAKDLNKKIFETIYFGALSESMNLAKEFGPYQTFKGSPLSKGQFQFDLWGLKTKDLSGLWNWDKLRENILIHGVRNSLVTACMPTASTSQIMNNNECFEPYTANIYTRSTLAGEYYVINKYLIDDLIELNLWNESMVDYIKYYRGSIQNIPNIPDNIKQIYRTAFELPQKSIIDMSADRGPFVDQTQSMNLFMSEPKYPQLNSCLFHAWKLGLKTGMYYLRSSASSNADTFGIDIDKIREIESHQTQKRQAQVCSIRLGDAEGCDVCSA